jgi:PUA-domain protein
MGMSHKFRRYSLKPKEAKADLGKVSDRLGLNVEALVDNRSNVEAAETDFGQFLLVNGKPLFFKVDSLVLPTLLFADLLNKLPRLVVDMGAVPHLCNGADLMAPGIVRVEGEFKKGDLVLVVDQKHGKSLALMEILYDSVTFSGVKKGVAAKSIHYVGDKYWDSAKLIE